MAQPPHTAADVNSPGELFEDAMSLQTLTLFMDKVLKIVKPKQEFRLMERFKICPPDGEIARAKFINSVQNHRALSLTHPSLYLFKY